MQLVFEFGAANIGPIIEAIQRVLGPTPYTVSCLPKDSSEYGNTSDTLASAGAKLGNDNIASFSLHPRGGLVRYALVTAPFFDGQPRSLYLGTIEYIGSDYKPIWNTLLATSGLKVVCLGYDEGLELEDDKLTMETFPWDEWPLAIGALWNADLNAWNVREGPEMKRLSA